MRDSRKLEDLHPRVRIMATKLLEQAAAAGIPLAVVYTLRSLDTQAHLYAQGRSSPGEIVTNARRGYSFHNFGMALDVVPTELLGLPQWGDTAQHKPRSDALWARLGAIGKAIGFRWGGDFRTVKDRPHSEWSGKLTLAQVRSGMRPSDVDQA